MKRKNLSYAGGDAAASFRLQQDNRTEAHHGTVLRSVETYPRGDNGRAHPAGNRRPPTKRRWIPPNGRHMRHIMPAGPPGSPGSEGSIGDFSPKYVDLDGDGGGGNAHLEYALRLPLRDRGAGRRQTQCIYGGGSYPEDDPTVGLLPVRGEPSGKRTAAICRASS